MIDEYDGMIDYIKFAGRERDINEFQHTIFSYLARSDDITIHSILPKATTKLMKVRVLDLSEYGAGAKWKNCKNKCADCNFCDEMYSDIIDDRGS
jgi:collagenase-like PrtC family protease